MEPRDRIALNFFPLAQQEFSFSVYRHSYNQGDEYSDYPGCTRRRLPSGDTAADGTPKYADYWVSFESLNGFEKYACDSSTNNLISVDYLYQLLKSACLDKLRPEEYEFADGFRKRIFFILDKFPEGSQTVWLEPYFLKRVRRFGFLADFRFQAHPDIKLTQRILQLSLSLDKDNRSNRDFYADRFEKLRRFISRFYNQIFPIASDSLEIPVHRKLLDLEAESLETKTYVFAGENTAKSQFNGLRQHGPLNRVDNNAKVYFIYREKDKPFSYDLFRALRGDTFRTFPGMERMFGYSLDRGNVSGTSVDDFTSKSLEKAIALIKQDAGERPVIPVLITPFRKNEGEEANRKYHIAKHVFLEHHISSQFVSLELLQLKNQLKWSVSNIALQLFAKMGGQPWRLVPQTSDCLIIGLGQSHRKTDDEIEKYFAYSILTESTGIYKDLRILDRSTDHETYIRNFRKNLKAIFEEYYDSYENFVVHATFSIRGDELRAVEEVLETMSSNSNTEKEFVAMKFNDKNKFFGYSTCNNSMIPYESSCIQLSKSEFLVWFEGLQYHTPKVRSKIERPMHIEFIYPKHELTEEQMRNYLQDAVNLSGANWRGFNAKSMPVSVYYAYLVASYFKEFQALDLEEIDLEAITPWFL